MGDHQVHDDFEKPPHSPPPLISSWQGKEGKKKKIALRSLRTAHVAAHIYPINLLAV